MTPASVSGHWLEGVPLGFAASEMGAACAVAGATIADTLASFAALDAVIFPYYWRVRTRLPEYFGRRCRVIARGKMNSCIVEFPDGFKAVTSRNYLRRRK